ncbi:MAG: type II 3-dehydroquinate dehydratase [Steroidobacteraceae bacterium]
MTRLLLLNGPNLNLLGTREPGTYGADTLEAIERRAVQLAHREGFELACFQSNAEHELIGRVQQAPAGNIGVLIFNPGAFTHTSIALRDAVLAVRVPMIEVHLSNPQAREEFRRRSYFSDIAIGVISGFGALGYELAVRAACAHLGAGERARPRADASS